MTMKPFKVHVDPTKTRYTFRFPAEVCACCGKSVIRRSIRVTYKTPGKPMTIFEGSLIAYIVYGLPSEDLIYPPRYPKCPLTVYTNCQAGREWLENIEKVEIL